MRYGLHLILAVGIMVGLVACDAIGTDTILDRITAPDDSVLPDSVRQQYQEDAAQLAMRRIQRTNPEASAVTLSDNLVQLYYHALVHVYATDDLTGRDTIETIHTFPRYNTHEVTVAVDLDADWTAAWQDGERLTGKAAVDSLLQTYDLSVESRLDASQPSVLLRSEAPINTVALGRRFEAIEGVEYAEQNGYGGDGNDIQARLMENAIMLSYSRGWGDCPAGCIHREVWAYRVDDQGAVRFINHEER